MALPSLDLLESSGHELVAVVTRPDAARGRSKSPVPSPVAAWAAAHGVETLKPPTASDPGFLDRLRELAPDACPVVAYGNLLTQAVLDVPRYGWVNLHFSLLPRWRGAAPVQHALIAGDRTTGAAVFQLVPALDAGDVYAQRRYDVPRGQTAGEVLDVLASLGAGLVTEVVDDIATGTAHATAQQGEPTLAPKLTLADGALDLEASADVVLDRYRGTTPEPGAHLVVDDHRLKVLDAFRGPDVTADGERLAPGAFALSGRDVLVGAADGTVLLKTVQPAGKGAMAAADWWRGLRGIPRAALLSEPASSLPEAGAR